MAVLSPEPAAMRRFLGVWLAALVVCGAAVLAVTVAVDPYGIIGTPRIAGFNADKTAAAERPRMTKPTLVERRDWSTIVLGASNADVGMDPTSAAWPEADRPVFNLAIDGSDPGTQLRFLQHALVTAHPKLVLLGLSLEDAMVFGPRRGTAVSAAVAALYGFEQRLRVRADGSLNPAYAASRLEDLTFATFSTQALTDSLLTVLHQRDPERTKQTEQGLNSAGAFARWLRTEGSYSLVMNKDQEKAPQLLNWAFAPRTSVAPIADIARLVRGRGARLVVFIMPGYVDALELMRQTGTTPLFEAWKLEVARTVERVAGSEPIPLWDFSGYSPYTTEQLAGPGDTSHPLKWFWEPVHFRAELGSLMIQRMLNGAGPADFGAPVTEATLPQRFADYASRQRDWVAGHPADVARLAGVVEAAAHQVCGTAFSGCPRVGTMPNPMASR